MPDTAISFEAPEVDINTGADDGAGLDASGEGAAVGQEGSGEGEGTPEVEGEPHKPFLAVDNGKLSKAAKETIDKLKIENPQLAKAVQRALFTEDRLRRELPGGFKDLAGLREKIEQLGGDEGIQNLQGELNGWKEFDAQYTAGDPKVLEFLTETPEAEAAFLKIAPAAFEKFRQVHPDGYSAYVSQVFLADMQERELPLTIQLLGSILGRATLTDPDRAEATKLYESLIGYVNRIGEFAKKQVAPPTSAAKAGADPRAAELDTREQAIRRTEWSNESGQQHARIFSEAWKRLAATVPKEKIALVRRLYPIHLQEKLAQKQITVDGKSQTFDVAMDRYFKAKQKDGFLRLHDSTFKDAVPLALRSAMAEAGIGARKAPAAAGASGEPALKPGIPAKPAVGFTPVAAKPNIATEVDRSRTTTAMWQNKQAILKSGKQVTWA